jgi:metallo-beta-lactamase family protein
MKTSHSLKFLGAARNVTGSCYLLQTGDVRLLVDCGLFQERQLRERNWNPFPVPPESIHAVLLTHAHLDHCGLLPKLVREGFHGPIYCTTATAEIARLVLLDSAHLQEEDARWKALRHEREGRQGPYPEVPLYTQADAEAVLPLFSPADYNKPVQVAPNVEASFHDAGHILGSSMVRLKVGKGAQARTILFSGDVGRPNVPILQDPTRLAPADYVVVESTYGDRLHESATNTEAELARIINETCAKGGNVVIPSFAVERAQEVLYHLNTLLRADRIPHLMVFFDSPMAAGVNNIFQKHPELFDREMTDLVSRRRSPFDLPGLKTTRDAEESKAINRIRGTVIIIAGSGMCTGGRIKHHLENNISRKECTILFVGYQAVGTLGRQIVDGAKEIRLFGQMRKVRALIVQLHGFSGHADRDEMYRWLSGLKKPPRRLFVTHGETEAALAFADFVRERSNWPVSVPQYLELVELG